jgi:TRAP-type C4-dicarboxylate transport system permease large subunit
VLTTKIAQYSKQEAQVVYIRALLPGSILVLALVAAYSYVIYRISATHHWTSDAQLSWHLFAIAATTGALGAVVSVLLRVANQPLTINYSAGRGLIRLAGVFRPVVGATFGLAFFVLINAGLLQVLATPHEMKSRAFFVAAICFAAGFSERRAQDVIVRAVPVEKGTEPVADQSPARQPNGGTAS